MRSLMSINIVNLCFSRFSIKSNEKNLNFAYENDEKPASPLQEVQVYLSPQASPTEKTLMAY